MVYDEISLHEKEVLTQFRNQNKVAGAVFTNFFSLRSFCRYEKSACFGARSSFYKNKRKFS